MLAPDDVEADLDTILKDRMVTVAAAEDDDDDDDPARPRRTSAPRQSTVCNRSGPTRRSVRAVSCWFGPMPLVARSKTTTARSSAEHGVRDGVQGR